MSDTAILHEIERERERQAKLHPADEQGLELFFALSILGEELGEAHKAAIELRAALLANNASPPRIFAFDTATLERNLRTELLDTASVAVLLLELLDRNLLHIATMEGSAASLPGTARAVPSIPATRDVPWCAMCRVPMDFEPLGGTYHCPHCPALFDPHLHRSGDLPVADPQPA